MGRRRYVEMGLLIVSASRGGGVHRSRSREVRTGSRTQRPATGLDLAGGEVLRRQRCGCRHGTESAMVGARGPVVLQGC